MNLYHFYLDESGARNPALHPDDGWMSTAIWFGMGGVLIPEQREAEARDAIVTFRRSWAHAIETLHSILRDSEQERSVPLAGAANGVRVPSALRVACASRPARQDSRHPWFA